MFSEPAAFVPRAMTTRIRSLYDPAILETSIVPGEDRVTVESSVHAPPPPPAAAAHLTPVVCVESAVRTGVSAPTASLDSAPAPVPTIRSPFVVTVPSGTALAWNVDQLVPFDW